MGDGERRPLTFAISEELPASEKPDYSIFEGPHVIAQSAYKLLPICD